MPLIEGDLVELDIYTQVAQIIDHGLGFTLPGIRFKLSPVTTLLNIVTQMKNSYLDISTKLTRLKEHAHSVKK